MFTYKKATALVLAMSSVMFSGIAGAEEATENKKYFSKSFSEDKSLTAIEDGQTQLKFSFFENVPEQVVTAIKTDYPNQEDPALKTSINTFLIQTPQHTVLIDTGGGKCMGENAGFTAKALADLKIDPQQIDTILLTHAHTDHICGLANKTNDEETWIPAYPNATIYISKQEYDFWMNGENGKQVQSILKSYENNKADSVKIFTPGDRLLETFDTRLTAGHTVGHIAYVWQPEAGNSWLFWGDVMHNAAMQFAHPEISIKFDTDAELAKATRATLMQEAADKKWMVAGAHLPYPGIGKITQDAKKQFIWQAE